MYSSRPLPAFVNSGTLRFTYTACFRSGAFDLRRFRMSVPRARTSSKLVEVELGLTRRRRVRQHPVHHTGRRREHVQIGPTPIANVSDLVAQGGEHVGDEPA